MPRIIRSSSPRRAKRRCGRRSRCRRCSSPIAIVPASCTCSPSSWPISRPERIAFRVVEDQDWTRVWMDQFQPMRFGRRLWIYPWNIQPRNRRSTTLSSCGSIPASHSAPARIRRRRSAWNGSMRCDLAGKTRHRLRLRLGRARDCGAQARRGTRRRRRQRSAGASGEPRQRRTQRRRCASDALRARRVRRRACRRARREHSCRSVGRARSAVRHEM